MQLLKTQKYLSQTTNNMDNTNKKGKLNIGSVVAGPNSKIIGAKTKVTDKTNNNTTINLKFKHYLEIGGASFLGGFLASLLANWIL